MSLFEIGSYGLKHRAWLWGGTFHQVIKISELCMSFSSAAICAVFIYTKPKAHLWENVAIMWTTKIASMFSSHTASNHVTMTYVYANLSYYKLHAKQWLSCSLWCSSEPSHESLEKLMLLMGNRSLNNDPEVRNKEVDFLTKFSSPSLSLLLSPIYNNSFPFGAWLKCVIFLIMDTDRHDSCNEFVCENTIPYSLTSFY